MLVIQVLSIGAILIFATLWQWRLWEQYDGGSYEPQVKRIHLTHVIIPGLFCVVLTVGFFGFGIIRLCDDKSRFTIGAFLSVMGKVIVFDIMLLLKTWFARILTGIVVAVEIYNLTEYKQFAAIPILSALFDWLFDSASPAVGYVYLVAVLMYGCVTSELEHIKNYLLNDQ